MGGRISTVEGTLALIERIRSALGDPVALDVAADRQQELVRRYRGGADEEVPRLQAYRGQGAQDLLGSVSELKQGRQTLVKDLDRMGEHTRELSRVSNNAHGELTQVRQRFIEQVRNAQVVAALPNGAGQAPGLTSSAVQNAIDGGNTVLAKFNNSTNAWRNAPWLTSVLQRGYVKGQTAYYFGTAVRTHRGVTQQYLVQKEVTFNSPAQAARSPLGITENVMLPDPETKNGNFTVLGINRGAMPEVITGPNYAGTITADGGIPNTFVGYTEQTTTGGPVQLATTHRWEDFQRDITEAPNHIGSMYSAINTPPGPAGQHPDLRLGLGTFEEKTVYEAYSDQKDTVVSEAFDRKMADWRNYVQTAGVDGYLLSQQANWLQWHPDELRRIDAYVDDPAPGPAVDPPPAPEPSWQQRLQQWWNDHMIDEDGGDRSVPPFVPSNPWQRAY